MPLETKNHLTHNIVRDVKGNCLWVNGKNNCLGRFTPLGFEIYRALEDGEWVEPNTQTLEVKIKNLEPKDWDSFVTLMKTHHGIDISGEHNPLI